MFGGNCELCNRHLCGNHLDDSSAHLCPKTDVPSPWLEQDETDIREQKPDEVGKWIEARRESKESHLRRLIREINITALCTRASLLRNGMNCSVWLPREHECLKSLDFGGFNLHVDIKFNDGIVWIARFRLLKINRPSIGKINFDRLSEVAVYSRLRQTTIPVPVVYDFALDGNVDNPVGMGYILLQKLSGHQMDWNDASTEQKNRIFRQLRDTYLEIEKIPQPSIGRPIFTGNQTHDIQVGPNFFEYDATGSVFRRGPFSTSSEWYKAL